MKILLVSNGIYPETIGGIEVCVSKLSKLLSADGHDVTVLLPDPEDRQGPTPEFCSIHHYDPKVRIFGNPTASYPYKYIAKNQSEFDVVHGHSHLFSGSVFAAIACRRFDVPYILTSHGYESQTAPMLVNKIYNNTVGRLAFHAADAVMTYTSTEVENIRGLGVKEESIHHITRGIDIESFRPKFEKSRGPVRLLWVSRFVPGKGAHIVIEAIHQLRQRGIDVEATLIGEGPQRSEIEDQIMDLGLSSETMIRGFVSEEELREAYREATLFVLPSVSEGMNRTLLEAMVSGTPVVLSDIPHFRELVEDCGKIVPELSGRAFANAIDEMLEDDLREMGSKARERVKGRFTWEKTFEDIKPVYESVSKQQQLP